MIGLPVTVRTNGILAATFTGGGVYTYDGLGNGQTIVLTVPISLSIERSVPNLVLNWPGGTLLESASLAGPWTTNPAAAPYTITQRFYRVQRY